MTSSTSATKILGEVCEILIGGTPRRGIAKYWENGILPWVSIADLSRSSEVITDTKEKITKAGAMESNVKLIPKGALIFSFKLSIGKMAFTGVDLYTNEAIAGLVIKNENELDKKFLYFFLRQTVFDTAHKSVKGNTLNKEKIKRIEIPLPPLSEQREIVAKLEKSLTKVKEAKKLRAEAQKATNQLLSAELHRFFEGERNKGWEEKDLRKVCKFKSGGTPSKSNASYWIGEIPWISPKDMKSLEIISTIDHVSSQAIVNSATTLVPRDTILVVVRSGILKHTLPVAITKRESTFNQDIKSLTVDKVHLLPKYLLHFLLASEELILNEGVKQGVTVQSVIKNYIEDLKIPLPPLTEQKKIVARLDALSAKILALQEHQKKTASDLIALEQSILSQAFLGNL